VTGVADDGLIDTLSRDSGEGSVVDCE